MLKHHKLAIKRTLNAFDVPETKKAAILASMEEAIKAQGDIPEQDIVKNLTSPQHLAAELAMEYDRKLRIPFSNTLLRFLLPLAIAIFFYLGLMHNAWHPGWLIFLTLPVAVAFIEIINDRERHFLASLSPFLFPTLFLLFGVFFGAWHPAWVLLLLMFVFPLLNSYHGFANKNVFLSLLLPLILIPLTVSVAELLTRWHPTWVLLLLILMPLHRIHATKKTATLSDASLTLAVLLYLALTLVFAAGPPALYVFTLYWLTLIYTRPFKAIDAVFSRMAIYLTLALLWVGFVTLGITLTTLSVSWVIFFTLPIAYSAFNPKKQVRFTTAAIPLVLAAFFLLGLTLDAWHPGWLLLLLLPILKIFGGRL